MEWRRLALLLMAFAVGGCASVDYYLRAASGQLDLLAAARPVDDLLADPGTDPVLAARLREAGEMLDFAAQTLGLPVGDSYRDYAALGRDYVVWNVFAAPEFALEPERWCYPLVGCLAYRGHFDPASAEHEAARQRALGRDVHVAGVVAYSTLGWFEDPLLDTFLFRRRDRLAELLFHELAHRRLFVAGDTPFNESYATAVAAEGVRRWLRAQDDSALLARRATEEARRDAVVALLLDLRGSLEVLYRQPLGPAAMRAAKAARLAGAQADYAALRSAWGEDAGFDDWMSAGLNNAKLGTIGLYHRLVPGFQALLAQQGGDLEAFHAAVAALAEQPEAQRHARLVELATLWPESAGARSD